MYKENNKKPAPVYILVTCLLLFFFQTFPQRKASKPSNYQPNLMVVPRSTLININNISMWAHYDGTLGNSPSGYAGTIFPRGTAGVVFQEGLVWAGIVKDGGKPELRSGGHTFANANTAGQIISNGVIEDQWEDDVRAYRIRRDYANADLRQDTAEFFNVPVQSVSQEQIDAIRTQYEKDWKEWPWQKGAPFYDVNSNGILDLGEEPGLGNADQVVWLVYNDLGLTPIYLPRTPSIGLEIQTTLWAYDRTGTELNNALQNIIFKRHRFVYKGASAIPDTAHIDNMYIAQWSDIDLGFYEDDFVGCDTILSLGYGYNSSTIDEEYYKLGLPAPAVGYVLLQGPIVPGNPEDVATFDFKMIPGLKNLPMTSFAYLTVSIFLNDPGFLSNMEDMCKWYNLLRGFQPVADIENPVPLINPITNHFTKFALSGNPVNSTGWIDGITYSAGDRKILLSTGAFNMALGDSQDVVVALVAGLGSDRLASVSVMKYNARWAKFLALGNFEIGFKEDPGNEPIIPRHFQLFQNFPNPFNPSTEIRFDLPVERFVKLTVYNLLGQKVKTLVDETKQAGIHSVFWDGTNERSEKVASGVYFYQIETGAFVETKKMIILK